MEKKVYASQLFFFVFFIHKGWECRWHGFGFQEIFNLMCHIYQMNQSNIDIYLLENIQIVQTFNGL